MCVDRRTSFTLGTRVCQASYPQLWLLRRELNLPFNGPHVQEPKQEDKICAVCGTLLSEEEMSFFEKTHNNFVCKFHRRKAKDVNIQRTREELGYNQFLHKSIDTLIATWKL